jgi:amino acid permease
MNATEVLKIYENLSQHLVTIATTLFALSITFLDKLRANLKTKGDYNTLISIWILLTISIFVGLYNSYLCVNRAILCGGADNECKFTSHMKDSLIVDLIVFSLIFILMARLGYKALINSKNDSITQKVRPKVEVVAGDPKK